MLEFVVQTKTNTFRQVAFPKSAHVELLWNAVSFADLAFDDDDKVWADLAPGARVKVLFDGTQVMCGPMISRGGIGPLGETSARIIDDFWLFSNLGWQKPAAAISAQTDEYKRYSGVTETVVKAAAADLSTRLGYGWTIPTTTGLGSTQRVEFRMHELADKFVGILNADKLTWSIVNGTVDVKQGALFPRTLTPESGVLTEYQWSESAPSITRVVVGGEGEGTARLFKTYTDTAAETKWGFISEGFKDSRMAQGITDLSPDGAEALAEGAAKVSVSADLQESSWFRFGTYKVGDRVHVQAGAIDVTEVIRSVVIDDTPDEGEVVVPHIGALEGDDFTALGSQLANLGRGISDQRRR